jgi:hypothetical protein
MNLFGGIETGGTKFVSAVGSAPDHIIELSQFPTTTPDETIGQAIAFFQRQTRPIKAVGIGSFGPVDLGTGSPTYGKITNTPQGWLAKRRYCRTGSVRFDGAGWVRHGCERRSARRALLEGCPGCGYLRLSNRGNRHWRWRDGAGKIAARVIAPGNESYPPSP